MCDAPNADEAAASVFVCSTVADVVTGAAVAMPCGAGSADEGAAAPAAMGIAVAVRCGACTADGALADVAVGPVAADATPTSHPHAPAWRVAAASVTARTWR